jgi:hypothetical protein
MYFKGLCLPNLKGNDSKESERELMAKITVSKIKTLDGMVYLTINHEKQTVSLVAPGRKIEFELAINILMANSRIVGMMNAYLRKPPQERRKLPFAVWNREGMSGCLDLWVQTFKMIGDTYIPYKHGVSLHKSCAGKLNEDLTEIYIGDLCEILIFLKTGKSSYDFDESYDIEWFPSVQIPKETRVGHRYVPYNHANTVCREIHNPADYNCIQCDPDEVRVRVR